MKLTDKEKTTLLDIAKKTIAARKLPFRSRT